jgi:predicted phage-related endonuclease
MANLDHLKRAVGICQFVSAEREKLNDRLKELDEVEKGAVEEIKDALGGEDGTEVTGTLDGKPVVQWTYSTRNALSQQVLKEEYPDVHKACYRSTTKRKPNLEIL